MEPYGRIGREVSYPLNEMQFVMPIRCGDARDGSRLETEIFGNLTVEYAARGVKVRVARVNMAGSVVNLQSYIELKSILRDEVRESARIHNGRLAIWEGTPEQVALIPVVQISGHANINVAREDAKLTYEPREVSVADMHSTVNCGMSHAGEVWKELVDMLLGIHPAVTFFDKTERKLVTLRLESEETLQRLLVSAYIHEGPDVLSFLRNIDLLEQPLLSKAYLRMQLDQDLELARIPVHINASLIDYSKGLEVRVDDNQHVHTILDDVAAMMAYVMERLPVDHPEKVARGSKQRPVCGIICPSDIHTPRDTVVNYINQTSYGKGNIDVAGSAFLTTGNDLYNPFAAFGPYKMGGIAYSIVKLNIRDYYIVAKTPVEADIIERKIGNDPILSVLMEYFNVRLIKLTLAEIEAQGVQKHSSSIDRDVLDLIDKGVKDFPKHPNSVLNRSVKEPRVLELLRCK